MRKLFFEKRIVVKKIVAIVLATLFSGMITTFAEEILFPDDLSFYYQKKAEDSFELGDTYYYTKDGSKNMGHLPKFDGINVACDKENYCYINENGYINMSYNGEIFYDIGKDSDLEFEWISFFCDGILIAKTKSDDEIYYYKGKLIYELEGGGFLKALENSIGDGLIPVEKLINTDNIYYIEWESEYSNCGSIYRVQLDGSTTFVAKDVVGITILPNDLYKYYIKDKDGNLSVYNINSKSLTEIDDNVVDYLLYSDGTYYVVKSKTILLDLTKLINVDGVEEIKKPSLFDKIYKSDDYKTYYEAYERDIKAYNEKREKNKKKYRENVSNALSYPYGYSLKLYDIYYFDGLKHNLIAKDAVYAELKKDNNYDKNIEIVCTKWDENVKIDVDDLYLSDNGDDINKIFYRYFYDVSHYIVNRDKASLLDMKNLENFYIGYLEDGKAYCFISDGHFKDIKEVVIDDKKEAIIIDEKINQYVMSRYKNYQLIREDKKFYLYDLKEKKSIYEYDDVTKSGWDSYLYKNGFIFITAIDESSTRYQIKYIDMVNKKEEIIADDVYEYEINERIYSGGIDKSNETTSKIIMNKKYTLLYDDFVGNEKIKSCIEKLKEKSRYVANSSLIYKGKTELSDKLVELAKYYSVDVSNYNAKNDGKGKSDNTKDDESKKSFEIEKIEELNFRFKANLKSKKNITLFLYNPVIKDNTGKFTAQINYLNEILKNQREVFVQTIEKTLDYQSKDGLCNFQNFELEYDDGAMLNVYFNGYLQFDGEKEKYDMKYVLKYNLNEATYQFVDMN